jgi:ATP-binding cassette, subfamily B, bacterial
MKNKASSFLRNLRFFAGIASSMDRWLFFMNMLLYGLLALMPITSLWFLKKMMDLVVKTANVSDPGIWSWFGLFLIVQVVMVLLQNWSIYLQQKQQGKLSAEISAMVAGKASTIEYAYFENPSFYDAMYMAQQQSLYLPAQLIQSVQSFFQHVFMVISLSVFLFHLHWMVPAILLSMGIPLALSRIFFSRKLLALEKSLAPDMRRIHDFFQYLTSHFYAKEVRVFGIADFFGKKYRALQDEALQKRNQLQHLQLKKSGLLSLFEVVLSALFYVVLIFRTVGGFITIGGLIVYLQAFQRLQSAINSMYRSATGVIQHQLYLNELFQFLHLPSRSRMKETVAQCAPQTKDLQRVEALKLSFGYPGTSQLVIKELCLSINRGELVAVVGQNGSGKSTLLKLLCGLYEPETRGSLVFDGRDCIDLDDSFFSSTVSAVFQDFGKYYLTVEENVAIGQEQSSPEKLYSSLKEATAESIWQLLPEKTKTLLGRTYVLGHELSGGQWQKIALARALYKQSSLLLLDEPTSSVDATSEKIFLDHLQSTRQGRMTVLVTHRLHNLKNVDRIYVMDDGVLVEAGKFDELIALHGHFHKLYSAQHL